MPRAWRNSPPVLRAAVVALAAALTGVVLALIPAGAIATAAASPGDLCLYGNDGTVDTGDAMMPGTNPAITAVNGGRAEAAFQTSTGVLATYADATGSTDVTDYGLDPKSSPAISAYSTNLVVAFTANGTDELWTGNGSSESPAGVVLEAGTSPAVAAVSASSDEYAFANQNQIFESGNGSSWATSQYGLQLGTSPAITILTGGGYEADFEANGGELWNDGTASTGPTGEGMDIGTSPAIADTATSGDFEMSFQANTNFLYIWGDITNANTGEGMSPGTNPAITAIGSSGTGYELAWQAPNGDLWVDGSDSGLLDTGHAMAPGTSPAIAQTASGYEVAYQCAPPTPAATTTATTTVTTPTPAPGPSTHSVPRIHARLAMRAYWDRRRHVTHVVDIHSIARLPHDALITFSCRAGGKHAPRCPRLGVAPRARRTLARELAVVAGRTFGADNVLSIRVSARRYASELFTVTLPGDRRPRITARWI